MAGIAEVADGGVSVLTAQATVSTRQADGATVARFARLASSTAYGGKSIDVAGGATTVVYASGPAGAGTAGAHSLSSAGASSVNFASGAVTTLTLATPPLWIAHAVLMSVSWGILVPIAILLARFGKGVTPTSGPKAWWFHNHWRLQVAAVVLACAGFAIALAMTPPGRHMSSLHHILGTVVVGMGIAQPLLGNKKLRPPKVPASWKRVVWEVQHKGNGYAAAVLGAVTVFLGLQRMAAPAVATTAYAAWVAALGAAFIGAEVWRRRTAAACAAAAKPAPPLVTTRAARSSSSVAAPAAADPAAGPSQKVGTGSAACVVDRDPRDPVTDQDDRPNPVAVYTPAAPAVPSATRPLPPRV
jgi:hypothetical protein